MSLRKSPKVSSQMISANRRNAQKSTGPRTKEGKRQASLNNFRHGCYATPDAKLHRQMEKLGENPGLLARIEQDLTKSWQPADTMQAFIVSDLAKLYWMKAQLEATRRVMREAEMERDAASLEERIILSKSHRMDGAEPVYASIVGRRACMKCPADFEYTLSLLAEVRQQVDGRQFDKSLTLNLDLLYGERPRGRGKRIVAYVHAFATDPVLTEYSEPAQPSTGATEHETVFSELERLVVEDTECVTAEAALFARHQKESLTAGHGSSWLPTSSNWDMVLKQQASIDRQIESKAKLLMRLKSYRAAADRNGEREAESLAAGGDRESRLELPDWAQPDSESQGKK